MIWEFAPPNVTSPAFHHHFVIPTPEVTRIPHHLPLEVSYVYLHHCFTEFTLNCYVLHVDKVATELYGLFAHIFSGQRKRGAGVARFIHLTMTHRPSTMCIALGSGLSVVNHTESAPISTSSTFQSSHSLIGVTCLPGDI